MRQQMDITNQRFGMLVALYEVERKGRERAFMCRCDCGVEKAVRIHSLRLTKKPQRSCGCQVRAGASRKNRKDLTGLVVGRLTAVRPTEQRQGRFIIWECDCSCGNKAYVVSSSLLRPGTTSCGCYQKECVAKLAKQHPQIKHGRCGKPGYWAWVGNKKRAAKLERTPPWSDQNKIRDFYANRPEGCQVDHIIPLQGELVSGLHVPHNLQYLSKFENGSKNNRFTPQVIPANRPNELPGVYWGK